MGEDDKPNSVWEEARVELNFLGMLFLASLQNAVLRRVRQQESERKPFFLYVDEFQSVATQSFISLVSECRKFGLGLILANQFISQVRNARIMESVLGNIGTLMAFRLGSNDAELVEREMLPDIGCFDLTNLPNHMAYAKALRNGRPSPPFLIHTELPPSLGSPSQVKSIRERCRARYSRCRQEVEEEIARSLREVKSDS